MATIAIGDAGDDRLSDYLRLTDVALRSRREPADGLFIAEGAKVARRALAAGCRARSLLVLPRFVDQLDDLFAAAGAGRHGDVPVYVAEAGVLRGATGFHVHRGVLAALHRPRLPPLGDVLATARRVAVLEDIVDHANVGAAFRAAAALGIDAVLVTPRCADPLYRRSVRVSMGTVFQVPWTRLAHWPGDVAELRAAGFTVAAFALADDAIALDVLAADPPPRLALVFGTEGDGLSDRTLAACDVRVRIPMTGAVDSLNVGAAAAVAFWALRPGPRPGSGPGSGSGSGSG